jgi:hypothetical protein
MTTEAEYAQRKAEHLSPLNTLTDEQLKAEVAEAFGRLAAEMGSLSEAQATWKPAADEWSAAEVGDHVALGTGAIGNITALLARGQRPGDEDWDPPPRLRGDAGDLDGVRGRIRSLPAHTEELFDSCVATNRTDVTADNSFFGEMNWREWYYFLRVHALAHVEQIQKLRGSAGFPAP